jgi:hypothetical protein
VFSEDDWYGLGLKLGDQSQELDTLFEKLTPYMDKYTVIGRLEEIKE